MVGNHDLVKTFIDYLSHYNTTEIFYSQQYCVELFWTCNEIFHCWYLWPKPFAKFWDEVQHGTCVLVCVVCSSRRLICRTRRQLPELLGSTWEPDCDISPGQPCPRSQTWPSCHPGWLSESGRQLWTYMRSWARAVSIKENRQTDTSVVTECTYSNVHHNSYVESPA